jgi:hypothetical protein
MKKIILTTFLIILVSVALVAVFGFTDSAVAQDTATSTTTSGDNLGYTPLETLPGVSEWDGTLSGYLNRMFSLFIGICAVLAILMIVISGFQYMTSGDSEGARKEAKSRITGAILGLLIALSSVLILETINPDLLNFELTLKNIEGGGGGVVDSPEGEGEPWNDDSQVRGQLVGNTGISINKPNCQRVGETNCTSVYGLSSRAIDGLTKLAQDCNCAITVSGGTEYWLHSNGTQHKPGGSVVDILPFSAINTFITGGSSTSGLSCHQKFNKNGVTFSWESASCTGSTGNHWHIIF